MHTTEKILLGLSSFIKLSLIGACILSVIRQNWLTLFIAVAVFLLTFLPALLEHNYKVTLPVEFEFISTLFIYGTLYLGEVHSYYEKFWWWDSVLHGFSAIAFGIIGFLIVYVLDYEEDVAVQMNAGFVFLFSFAFAVMIGAVWEIFEFAMDSWFGLNMQKSGLVDTMWDLIVDSLGALLASFAGYLYLKKGEASWFGDLIESFVEKNPNLFN